MRAGVIEDALREAGYGRVTIVHEIVGLVRRIEETAPDVIVIDIENPNRDALESLFQVSRSVQRPIAMFVDHSDRGMIEAAVEAGVSAYIVDGLKKFSTDTFGVNLILDYSNFNLFFNSSLSTKDIIEEIIQSEIEDEEDADDEQTMS